MSRLARLILIASCTAAIAGCSVVRLAYENADWFALREIDDFVDLDDAQRGRVAATLAARLVAHRRDELPAILALLTEARAAAADGLDEEEIERFYTRARTLVRETVERNVPPVVRAIGPLAPEQVEHLASAMESRNAKWRDKYLPESTEERRAQRVERTVDRIEHWTGGLDESQVALVARLRDEMPETAQAWFAYRVKMQARLLALLRGGAGHEAVTAFLVGWWAGIEDRDPDLERKSELIEAGIRRIAVRVDETLDEDQRARALDRLDGYIESFGALLNSPARNRPSAPRPSAPKAAAGRGS